MEKGYQAGFSLLGKGIPVRNTTSQSIIKPSLKLESSNFKLLQLMKILALSQVISSPQALLQPSCLCLD